MPEPYATRSGTYKQVRTNVLPNRDIVTYMARFSPPHQHGPLSRKGWRRSAAQDIRQQMAQDASIAIALFLFFSAGFSPENRRVQHI
eukprot:3563639-Amphidinium_carterae.1